MSCAETGTCGTGSYGAPVTLPGDPIMGGATITAVAAFGGIEVKWSLPTENLGGLSKIHVFRSTVADEGTAVLQSTVAGDRYVDTNVTGGIQYFYWIQMLSVQGTLGPMLGPVSCVAAVRYEQIIADITGQITIDDVNQIFRDELARLNTLQLGLDTEIADRLALDTNLTAALSSVQSSYTGTYADIVNEQSTLTSDISSVATELNRIVAGHSNLTFATIINDYSTTAEVDSAIATAITGLQSGTDVDNAIATALVSYSTTVEMDSAISTATTGLQSATDVDNKIATALVSYSTTTEMNSAISTATIGLQSATDVDNKIATVIADYSTTTDMNAAIASATIDLQSATEVDNTVATALVDYSTTVQMNSAISSATTGLQSANDVTNSIASALVDYSTTVEMDSAISTATTGLQSASDVDASIASALTTYSTTTQMDSAIATATTGLQSSTDVDNAIASALTTYSTTTQMNSAISSAVTGLQSATQVNDAIASALTGYYTSTDADNAISTQITNLVSSINGYSGSVDILASTINGLDARWEVKTTVNDLVGSVGFYNSGTDIIFAITDGAEGLEYNVTQDKLTINGAISILPGSTGYGQLSDKPSALSDINGTEGTKLSGIQAGATVGADWSSNLTNAPANLTALTGAEAINNADVTPVGIGAETPAGAQAKADAAEAAAEAAAQAYADANFVLTSTHTLAINDLQSQIDGNITSWFYSGAPTLSNEPAVNWTTNTEKDNHLGDLYYDDVTGYAYRFMVNASVYSWQQLSDSDINAALAAANFAQDTADNKRRVFITTPSGPYDIGDLWDDNGTIKRATADRETGYLVSEWIAVANYTTSTSQLTDDANLGGTADWSNVASKPSDTEILNYVEDGSGIFIKQPDGGTYSGSWTGAIKIVLPQRRSNTMLSFSVDIYNYITNGSCTVVVGGYNYSDGVWRRGFARILGNPESEYTVRFGEDATNSLVYIGDTDTVWSNARITVRDFQGGFNNATYANWGSGWSITSATTFDNPSITKTDTLAHASDVNNINGIPVATVLDDISTAQSTADGKITSTFSTVAPSSPDTDDIWIDEGDGNKIKIWNGSSWVEGSDDRIAATVIAAQTAQTTADNKAEVFFSESTPTAESGDLWYKPSTKEVKRYNGTTWEDFATWGAKWGVDIDNVPGNLASLSGGEDILNSNVTLGGLGYTGALNADVTDYTDYRVSNSATTNSVTTITNPQGASYSSSSSTLAGAIVVHLPQGWTNTMMKFVVDCFIYSSDTQALEGNSFSLSVGGYTHVGSSQWLNTFAQLTGNKNHDNRVRFGITPGGKCCVVIGETTTDLPYLKANVYNFQAGHNDYTIGQWDDGWDITVETSLTGYTFTSDISDALIDAASVVGQGALATADVVDFTSQVTGLPDRLTDSATTGLNLTASYMGYHNGTQWMSYINDSGHMYLNGDASNYLSWDGTTMTIRGDIEASSVAASVSLSAPTITGGLLQTSSDTNVERLVFDSSKPAIEGYWQQNAEGIKKYIHIGKTTNNSIDWAMDIGIIGGELEGGINVLADEHGVRSTTYNQESIYGFTFGSHAIRGELSGTTHSGYAVAADARRAYGLLHSEGAYLDFRGGVAAIYLQTDDSNIAKGKAVVVNQVLAVSGPQQNVLFEVAPATADKPVDVLGIVVGTETLSDNMINHLSCFTNVTSGNFTGYQSTHYMAIVATDGIVVAHVNGLHGAVNPGDILCVDGGTNGTLRKFGTPTHGQKVAKALGSVANASSGAYIPVRML